MDIDKDAWKKRFEEARARYQEQKREQGTKPGSTAGRVLPHLPEDVFLRLGGVASEIEALKVCDTCGPIEPKRYQNGYLPGKCACQRAAEEEKGRATRLSIQKDARQQARRHECYTWLGPEWSDESLAYCSFQNFEMGQQDEALEIVASWYGTHEGTLVLWSEMSGTGKTHLAAALANTLEQQKGLYCLFSTAQNLFNAFSARIEDGQGYSSLLVKAGSCDLLVIDDLEKIRRSEFKQSIFFEVLDKRNKRKKPTVITTNARVELTPTEIIGIGEYVGRAAASRLADNGNGGITIVEMNGPDYRRRREG